jgi:hypothetical protein
VAYSTNFNVQDYGNDNVQLNMYPGANSTRYIQVTLYNPQGYIDPTNGTGNQTDIWDTGPGNGFQLTLNASPALGATTGTLVAPAPVNGIVTLIFSGPNTGGSGRTSQTVSGTLTQGSTAISWGTPLTSNLFAPNIIVQGVTSGGLGADSPIIMDKRILELGAAWWCLQERGESLGANSTFSEERFRTSMDDLIQKDVAMQGDLMMIVA